MRLRLKHDGFVLDSGREVYANNGIVGMDPNGNVFEGYDGVIEYIDPDEYAEFNRPRFTPEERKELAGHMVALWKKWGGL